MSCKMHIIIFNAISGNSGRIPVTPVGGMSMHSTVGIAACIF